MSEELAARLRARLAGARGVAVLGVGYELGSDDGVGLAAAELIRSRLPGLPVYLTGSAPENYTGPVTQARPSHVVFIDAAELGRAPGTVEIIEGEAIGGARFSTHTLPLSTIMEYLALSIGADSFALGIQPEREGYGEEITPAVRQAAERVADALVEAIRGTGLMSSSTSLQ